MTGQTDRRLRRILTGCYLNVAANLGVLGCELVHMLLHEHELLDQANIPQLQSKGVLSCPYTEELDRDSKEYL